MHISFIQEPEPVIRSQTVVLRRSSDGKKQENADDDKTQAQQQERQDQPIIRSRTVLLKQSAEIDQQGDKQEEKDSSLDPPESSTRLTYSLISYNHKNIRSILSDTKLLAFLSIL